MLITGYDDLAMVHHEGPLKIPLVMGLSLPVLPFTIAMPALSLLLVFRTNTATPYDDIEYRTSRTTSPPVISSKYCQLLAKHNNSYTILHPI